MQEDSQKLAKNFKQAPIWQILDQGAGRFVRIAASVALARILFPDDFGIYALSLSILELARLSVNFGVGSAIVQTSDSPDSFVNSAFWTNLGASALMFINVLIFAFLAARIFGQPVLMYTAPVLGITLLTGGFAHINQSLLIRTLEFKTLAKASVSKLAVESVASIGFAVAGFGVWSFILGYVLGDVVQSMLIWFSTEWRPDWKPNFQYPRKFWKFGANIFLFCLSTYLLEFMPTFIVGRITDAFVLGLFSFAWRQSRWIGDIPKLIGKNMLFPAFSRLQSNFEEFEKLYDRWLRFMLVWGAPIFIAQFVFSPLYVPAIFGAKWAPAITGLQLLVVMAFIEITFYVPHSEAVTARGRVEKNVYWRMIEALALGITLIFVSSKGPTAIAAGILVVRAGVMPFYLFQTRAFVGIKFKPLLKSVRPALVLCCAGWVGGLTVYKFSSEIHFLVLIGLGVVSAVLWVFLSLRFAPEIKKLFSEASKMLSARFNTSKQIVALTSE